MKPSSDQYHHSVLHYHSPLPMDHRNRPVLRDSSKYGPKAGEPIYPDAATTGPDGLVESVRRARSSSPSRKRKVANSMLSSNDPLAAARGGGVASRTEQLSDHLQGSGMMAGAPQQQMRDVTIQQGSSNYKMYNPLSHKSAKLTTNESNLAWLQNKSLLFGIHKRRAQPYVTPEEFYDPLRSGHMGKKMASGYIRWQLPTGTVARHSKAEKVDKVVGYRRGAPHATELPTKVNWHNPFNANGPCVPPGGDVVPSRQVKPNPGSYGHQGPGLKRLQATPLMEEVDERLAYQGCGNLTEIRLATNNTITEVLRECGFSGTERMTILWELRRQYPSPHAEDNSPDHGQVMERR